jgi:hypothetical protein
MMLNENACLLQICAASRKDIKRIFNSKPKFNIAMNYSPFFYLPWISGEIVCILSMILLY